jgi:type I restriction enzyme S subunit
MFKSYKLSEILTPVGDLVELDSKKTYKQIKLRLYNKGCELRRTVKGDEIFSKQYLAKKNQFIISKIDARNGAMGIIPAELDSSIVTGDFLLFDVNETVVKKQYFNLYTRHSNFIELCKSCSEGSTNRVRLKINKLLDKDILLPPIDVQVASLNLLTGINKRVKEISVIRLEQQKEIRNLIYSKYIEAIEGSDWELMSEIAPIIRREVEINENASYPELGIRSFGKGTFHKLPLTGFDVGSKTLYQIKAGDLLFSNVFAWEGAIAVAQPEDDNRFGSHRFISCEVDRNKAIAEFLCYHFLTPQGLDDINNASPGGAGRNKTLGLNKLMNIKVPVPLKKRQEEFAAFQQKMSTISKYHSLTSKELGELFPSLLDKAFKGEL